MSNPELHPQPRRKGKFQPRPATGKGHKEQSPADLAATIPGQESATYFVQDSSKES